MAKSLLHFAETNQHFTQGKAYPILEEYVYSDGDYVFEVIDDEGCLHLLTKYPDADGISYATWFNVIETEEAA